MITSLLIFLWGLFTAALKFALFLFGIIAKIVLVVLLVLLVAVILWRRRIHNGKN